MHTDLSIAVDKLTTEQMHEVNKCALHYGLGKQDFMSLLTRDLDEQESMRMAKEEEQERAMYSVIEHRYLVREIVDILWSCPRLRLHFYDEDVEI